MWKLEAIAWEGKDDNRRPKPVKITFPTKSNCNNHCEVPGPWPCRIQLVALPGLQPHCSSADWTCGCRSCFANGTVSKQHIHSWLLWLHGAYPTHLDNSYLLDWHRDIAVVTNATAAAPCPTQRQYDLINSFVTLKILFLNLQATLTRPAIHSLWLVVAYSRDWATFNAGSPVWASRL